MNISEFLAMYHAALAPFAMHAHEGQAYQKPALEVIAHSTRRVRTSRIPLMGRGLSLAACVAEPGDLTLDSQGAAETLARVATVMAHRHPPAEGLSILATVIVLTRRPIEPDDDAALAASLSDLPRLRFVPLALFKLNLDQQAFAFSMREAPNQLSAEAHALADAFCSRFRRFLPRVEM